MMRCCAAFAGVLVAGVVCAGEAPADLILTGGKVITVDGRFSIARALAVRGDRIVAVGAEDEVGRLRGPSTAVVELEGKCVLPGLIDSHCHPSSASLEELDHPRPPMESVKDVLRYVESRAGVVPKGQWIFIGQRFLTRLEEHRYPTRAELDRAAPDHPVVFRTGPDSCVNSAALRAAAVGADFSPPAGARAERDPATGELTGVFRNMNGTFTSHIPSPPVTPEARREALARMLGAYNRAGITGACDRDAGDDDIQAYQDLERSGALTVRVSISHAFEVSDDPQVIDQRLDRIAALPLRSSPRPLLRLTGIKLFLDGGMLTGSAFMSRPWGRSAMYGISDPEYRGLRFISQETLERIVDRAAERGLQVVAHSQGDGAIDALITAFEKLDRKRPVRDARMCIGHGSFMRLDLVRRAARIGVVADSQPAWLYLDAAALLGQFGEDRLRYFIPLRTWFEEGGVVAGGSDHMIGFDPDSSINPFNPFLGMWIALTRRARWVDGPVIGPEALTREQALRLYTVNSAQVSFAEKETGTLEPGKFADFIVIDRDILDCPVDEVKSIRCLATYLGGKRVHPAR